MAVTFKNQDTTSYHSCPKCKGSDIRGPLDTDPMPPHGHFTRSWFCRTCWWDASIKLRDEAMAPDKES